MHTYKIQSVRKTGFSFTNSRRHERNLQLNFIWTSTLVNSNKLLTLLWLYSNLLRSRLAQKIQYEQHEYFLFPSQRVTICWQQVSEDMWFWKDEKNMLKSICCRAKFRSFNGEGSQQMFVRVGLRQGLGHHRTNSMTNFRTLKFKSALKVFTWTPCAYTSESFPISVKCFSISEGPREGSIVRSIRNFYWKSCPVGGFELLRSVYWLNMLKPFLTDFFPYFLKLKWICWQ